MSDLKIINNRGIYDITLDSNGDLAIDDSFNTAIMMSLFVDKRADSSEVPVPESRRGWWGNLMSDIPNDEDGSKVWLFYQSRMTLNDMNKLNDEVKDCLQWFIDDGYLNNLQSSVTYGDNTATVKVTYDIQNSATESLAYELWQNTGTNGQL